jgi:2-polyprenyl-3-methyl-5-hydroxy-6-metoxy-1,4-benzoquinol methylase
MDLSSALSASPAIRQVVDGVLAAWPEHIGYCNARFAKDTPDFLARMDQVAELVLKIVGAELDLYCRDYRWMCEEFLKEEIHFARHKAYRLSTFEEAYREVYGDASYMSRYVRGILISQILWDPHARAFDLYRTSFLASLPQGSDYLEVGPGHGLFLFFASRQANIASLEAWDVSKSSIAETKATLAKLGVTRDISIVEQDVLAAPSNLDRYDGAVISEVLEHLEAPDKALRTLHAGLRPGGRIFINAPINSPAPDHIYLWRSTDEFVRFVEDQGFEIEQATFFPVTGVSLERALARDMSVSCIVVGIKR